ncbi:hypothetical protein Acsp06_59000 [Actinomycetospora sp. NBRC 106375]|uniref:hypothetical protein n=1 Tax=Actinomycetospora sp. NBRC 106375 TaxID=3032207 RepID=UPI0024A5397A|nr:hypothetical protein [Actinomycetospora sp. NBRC 106375]GLZ49715.1 hypothetical protein Acsp06_59000 [Actinomycetospora sp. NBRC 106375]
MSQAATLAAALRITTEDHAARVADGTSPPPDGMSRLSEAVRAATHGVVGDALTD